MTYQALDPKQLIRIESVHRGFLYQHLYAVACALSMNSLNIKNIKVENDEDIELYYADKTIYLQVKTRNDKLVHSDIADTLARFKIIGQEHTENRRTNDPFFAIITNAELSESLSRYTFDSNINILNPFLENCWNLPPAAENINGLISRCSEIASQLSFQTLNPETLCFKLSTHIQRLATGFNEHCLTLDELPELLELLVFQLNDIPELPEAYREQENEPKLHTNGHRAIVGLSGSGKTTLASQLAIHSINPVMYLDVSTRPEAAIAPTIAREITAFCFSQSNNAKLPVVTGFEALKIICKELETRKITINLFLDNVHCMEIKALFDLKKHSKNLNFIMFSQPYKEMELLASHFGCQVEELSGWSIDTIAEEFNNSNIKVDIFTCQKIKSLTTGYPLFVQNLKDLSEKSYDGDVNKLLVDIEANEHLEETYVEILLSKGGFK
jgi:hypothetical protein